MNRTAARSFALGALAIVVGRAAVAQRPEMPTTTTRPLASETVPLNAFLPGASLTSADEERLSATIRRADSLALTEAREFLWRVLYWSVVSEQRAAEEYPVTALHRLAFMYFSAGDDYAAANVLTELAESASEFGDPVTRLQSLFDAALLYRDAARTDRVLECVRQIRPLLKSVAIPEGARAAISRRIEVR